MGSKICSLCKQKKDFSAFHKSKKEKDGYYYWCKECRKIKITEYRPREIDRIYKYQKEYREKNKSIILAKKKEYYKKNRTEKLAKRKEYYRTNPEKVALCNKNSAIKHIVRVKETLRKYREANKERISLYHTQRRAGGAYTYQEIQDLKIYQQNKCFYCEINFDKKDKKYTIDHIIPIKNKGSNNIDNIVLACKSCNCSKQEKEVSSWIKRKFNAEESEFLLKKLADYRAKLTEKLMNEYANIVKASTELKADNKIKSLEDTIKELNKTE